MFLLVLKIYKFQQNTMFVNHLRAFTKHWLTTSIRLLFSSAADTLSLSAICLLTAASDACDPGDIFTSTLNLGGNDRNRQTLMDSPINVAIEQWGMVGV